MFINTYARDIQLFDIIWSLDYFYRLKNATILRYLIRDPGASCDEGAGLGGIPPSAAEVRSRAAEAGGHTIMTGE
jgi:hypothetical protein